MIDYDFFVNGGFLTFEKNARIETYEIAQESGTIGSVSFNAGDYVINDPINGIYAISPDKFIRRNDDLGNGNSRTKKLLRLARLANENGTLQTSYGEKSYTSGNQYIILQDPNDYIVLDKAVFEELYDLSAIEYPWGTQ
jgi:hypothetical protein